VSGLALANLAARSTTGMLAGAFDARFAALDPESNEGERVTAA
jgi:hypothetical protein